MALINIQQPSHYEFHTPNSKGKHRQAATVTKYLATISHVFSICDREWGWISENPVSKIKKPSLPRGRTRFLDDDERERLLEACRESSNKFLYTIVVIALSCGLRKGEIINLKWKNINFERRVITLDQTKNNDIRVLPFTGLAMELLIKLDKSRRLDTDYVFPSPNSNRPLDFRSAWLVALKKARISDCTFHTLRHCCGSYLLMSNVSLGEIAEILGHKNIQMSKRYSHLSTEHKAKLLASLNDKIFG